MKLEDNSTNISQAAVVGAGCQGLAVVPRCHPQVSSMVPKLQASIY